MYLKMVNIMSRAAFALPAGYTYIGVLDLANISRQVDLGVQWVGGSSTLSAEIVLPKPLQSDTGVLGVSWAHIRMFVRVGSSIGGINAMTDCGPTGTIPIQAGDTLNIICGVNYLIVNGVSASPAIGSPASYAGNIRMPIYAYGAQPFKGGIKKVMVNVNGAPAALFYPAKRDLDGALGLYDTVNNRFIQFF